MTFYCKNLEEKIFNKHTDLTVEPDELIIISGYLGPSPVERLKELPFKTTVIAGMYTRGVNPKLYNALKKSTENNPNLTVLFSSIEVHSKIYIWLKNHKPKYVLIGSANFSDNGLLTDFRESLADMDLRDYINLLDYYEIVKENSTQTPTLTTQYQKKAKQDSFKNTDIINNLDEKNGELSINLPLYASTKKRGKYVPTKSGLNWGLSSGHTAIGDAYISIPKVVINSSANFFPPFDPNYKSKSKRKRDSDPIEIIWDDGTVMEASAEGIQKGQNGKSFPKQLTSYSSKGKKELGGISKKSILGRYLRKRMNFSDPERLITINDLENYGRDSVTFTKISDGVYGADFSV